MSNVLTEEHIRGLLADSEKRAGELNLKVGAAVAQVDILSGKREAVISLADLPKKERDKHLRDIDKRVKSVQESGQAELSELRKLLGHIEFYRELLKPFENVGPDAEE